MRILYLCADRGIPLDGHKGAAAHVRGLVRGFARLGHSVTLLGAEQEQSADLASPFDDGALPIDVGHIPAPCLLRGLDPELRPRVVRALGHVWNNLEVERAVRAQIERCQPDLIYERYSPFAVAGSMVAAEIGIPHILEVNAPLAWEGSQYRRQSLQEAAELLERTAFAYAQHILVVSSELRDILVTDGADPRKIVVVPNGVDDELFNAEGADARRYQREEIVVGFTGSLKPWHGLGVLRDAFRLIAHDPRFRLLVVGDGPGAEQFGQLRAELPDRVTLTGAVRHDEVPALLREMDIAVAPYAQLERFYYSPLKLLEYMAAGTPIVASAVGQVCELIRHEQTGLLVRPGDPEALRAAIVRLADEPALRAELATRAAEEAIGCHSWTTRAATILELALAPTRAVA